MTRIFKNGEWHPECYDHDHLTSGKFKNNEFEKTQIGIFRAVVDYNLYWLWRMNFQTLRTTYACNTTKFHVLK